MNGRPPATTTSADTRIVSMMLVVVMIGQFAVVSIHTSSHRHHGDTAYRDRVALRADTCDHAGSHRHDAQQCVICQLLLKQGNASLLPCPIAVAPTSPRIGSRIWHDADVPARQANYSIATRAPPAA